MAKAMQSAMEVTFGKARFPASSSFPSAMLTFPHQPASRCALHKAYPNPLLHLRSSKALVPRQPSRSLVACAVGAEDVEVEPATNVNFTTSLLLPNGSVELSLCGTGFREKSIAFIRVKVYALGIYFASAISDFLLNWKGRKASDLVKDSTFFKKVAEAPVEKAIRIVLVRDVDGATFWRALDEALKPRLEAANAGTAGQEALDAFGEVFRVRSLKQGTSIYLSWVQPFKLQVAVSGGTMHPETVEASIVSAPLVSALFDVYLGENCVSPSAKASIASGLADLIQ